MFRCVPQHTLLLALTLLLGACAPGLRIGEGDPDTWSLSGKLGIRTADQAESVQVNWHQCGERYRILISGPLGQRLARIEGRPGRVVVAIDGEETITAEPEAWLYHQLGWSLPIPALRYWVQGLPAPGPVTDMVREDGMLRHLHQNGWAVEYREYVGSDGMQRPSRLIASGEHLRATLIVRRWQIGREAGSC